MSDGVKFQRGSCNLNVAGSFLKLRLVLRVEVSPPRKEQWEEPAPGGIL